MSDNNLAIPGGSNVDILLGESTSFIVQNISSSKLGFRLKTSGEETVGGVINPDDPMKFAEDITVWTLDKSTATVYILRA